MARIITLGSALQDVYLIDHDDFGSNTRGYLNQLALGDKIDIDKIHFSTGGGATNAATTFARHHHETIFIGNIANDPAGRAILDALDHEGVDTSYVSYLNKLHTGYSVLLLTPSGERTILTCRGASAIFDNLDPTDLDTIHPDWLYISTLRGDFRTLTRFTKKAKQMGAKVMFNPGNLELKKADELQKLLPLIDVLLLNKEEAKQLISGNDLKSLSKKLAELCPTHIITDGHQGALARYQADDQDAEIYQIGLYEDLPVLDATGAGDAFGSGFLAAFADGKSFTDALTFASANSTSVVQYVGTKQGILKKRTRLHAMPIQQI